MPKAVKLTTGAFDAMENDPRLSQAEAMRKTMAALVSGQIASRDDVARGYLLTCPNLFA